MPLRSSFPRRLIAPVWVFAALAVILLATLSPQPELAAAEGLGFSLSFPTHPGAWKDVFQNVMLYVPFGFVLAACHVRIPIIAMIALAVSVSTELLQLQVPGRDAALRDVIVNIAGAQVGALIVGLRPGRHMVSLLRSSEEMVVRSLRPDSRLASTLFLRWSIILAALIAATGWLLSPQLPPPFFYAVSGPLIDNGDGPLRIGSDRDSRTGFQGLIDEVRIFSSARTGAEILTDMRTPICCRGSVPAMIAAYDFDEGSGSIAADESGNRHDGMVVDATWMRGRFGGALSFDGRSSAVVIPVSPALDLDEGMTLEAWVYPVGRPVQWSPIVSRDGDAYYLAASADSGPFLPVGGAHFGGAPQFLRVNHPLLPRRWTHLAVTYDGHTLRMYTDGELAVVQNHWSTHRPVMMRFNGRDLPFGLVADPNAVRSALSSELQLEMRVRCGHRQGATGRVFSIVGAGSEEALSIAASGPDLEVRYATWAQELGLATPSVYYPGALRSCVPGRSTLITLQGTLERLRVVRDGAEVETESAGLSAGWAFAFYSNLMPRHARVVFAFLWIAALVAPLTFFARYSRKTWLGTAIIGAAFALAFLGWHVPPLSPFELVAGSIAAAIGLIARLLARRSL